MDADDFHKAALALPGAVLDVKWGNDRTYCINGKIFAGAGAVDDPTPNYTFKASDLAFELLIEQGLAQPAPYVGRYKWLQVRHDALASTELLAYLAQSHALIASGFTQKMRMALGMEG